MYGITIANHFVASRKGDPFIKRWYVCLELLGVYLLINARSGTTSLSTCGKTAQTAKDSSKIHS
jgi:hypothetical protein